ncbi:MAG: hypothetical protein VX152_05565 [Pseudomonadota bacterium]|nr:hypothetical protein [Pseudomonadota bacterium]
MQPFMKLCFVLLAIVLGSSLAQADAPAQPGPAKLAVIVDTSRSMIAPAEHAARSTSSLIREGLISSVTAPAYPLEVDLWQFNGRDNPKCTPHLVHDAALQSGDSLVKSLNDLKHLQAESGILLDQKRNAISGALSLASSRAVGGIVLITDRLNDCHLTADQVCALAGELAVPLNVLSFAVSNRARRELECLAEVSHGTFMQVSDGREAVTLINAMITLSAARARVSVAEQLNLELSHHIETLVHNNRELIENNEELIAENTELTIKIGDLREENGRLNEQVAKLEEELAAARKIIKEQEAIIEEQRVVIAKLEQQLADAQAEIVTLEEHIARLIEDRDALHAMVVELEGEVTDLKVKLESCNTKNVSLKDRIIDLEAQIKKLEQTVIIATDNCQARIDAEAGRWQTKLDEQASDYEARIELLQQTINEKTVELGKKDEAIGKLHAHIAELDEQIVSLNKALAEEREQNAVLTSENTKLKEIIVGLEATIAKLMKDLELCRSENYDLHHELKSATGQLEQCQTEKSALEGYLKETKALLKSCEAKLGAAHTKLSQLEAVQGENKILREKIAGLDDKYHQCVSDKATFLEGLSPLIVDHLEEGSEVTKP